MSPLGVAGRYAAVIERCGCSHGRSARLATDRELQLLDALTVVVHAIADNRVKLPHARRILHSLQQLGIDLQKVESATSDPPESSSPQHSKTTTSQPNSRLYNQQ